MTVAVFTAWVILAFFAVGVVAFIGAIVLVLRDPEFHARAADRESSEQLVESKLKHSVIGNTITVSKFVIYGGVAVLIAAVIAGI